jgi:RNA polymerase-binding transcription factor DksA
MADFLLDCSQFREKENTFQDVNVLRAVDLCQGALVLFGLGFPYSAEENAMTSIAARKAQLESRLADLTGRLQGIEAELDSHQAQDWEELATEREGDEVLEGMGVNGQLEMRQIKAALHRVAEGEYGFCTKCGAEIGDERLDLLPHTPFCRTCAA